MGVAEEKLKKRLGKEGKTVKRKERFDKGSGARCFPESRTPLVKLLGRVGICLVVGLFRVHTGCSPPHPSVAEIVMLLIALVLGPRCPPFLSRPADRP